jgi:hypothetical protein
MNSDLVFRAFLRIIPAKQQRQWNHQQRKRAQDEVDIHVCKKVCLGLQLDCPKFCASDELV